MKLNILDFLNIFPKKEYLLDPNGQDRIKTKNHLVGLAQDGAPNCDRCKNGELLSSMDPCHCGRMG